MTVLQPVTMEKKYGRMKQLNYGYLILIFLSLWYDLAFVGYLEAFGGFGLFFLVFILIFLYPKGKKWSKIALMVLCALNIITGIYVIYVNLLQFDSSIPTMFRYLISILWVLNIAFYGYVIKTITN